MSKDEVQAKLSQWTAKQVWNIIEGTYSLTGLRIQRPIEYFWPGFAPWLFGKMIGSKPNKIEETENETQ